MELKRLRLKDFRNFSSLEWCPRSGLNFLCGENGVGKTSVLEAVHLLAYGRSFRGRVADGLIRRGCSELEVFAQWRASEGAHQAGLRHSGRHWEARLDNDAVGALADLCRALAVVTFEPGSQRLVSGPSEARRRYLDWLLFHVEPEFLIVWRRYTRALKQRNALLKQQAAVEVFLPWEHELGESGEALTAHRRRMLERLKPALLRISELLVPELGPPTLDYHAGWRAESLSLMDALAANRGREQQLGHTESGPHRADWRLSLGNLDARSMLSRGQEKMVSLACVLAQAEAMPACGEDAPVFCFDDLPSEIDELHLERLVGHLLDTGGQVIMSGVSVPDSLREAATVFHVEHGEIHAI